MEEAGRLFQLYQNERSVISREEDKGGRARDNERVGQEAELNRDQVMEISRLSSTDNLICERENLIFDTFVDFLASGQI